MKLSEMFLAGTLLSFGMSSWASAELISNGSFETGDFSGWTLNGDPSNNVVSSGFPHTGIFAAFFGETDQLGSLSQTISTTPNTEYMISFWFAGDGSSPSQFRALVAGEVLLDISDPPLDEEYQNYRYNFIATDSLTEVVFEFRNDIFFLNLDDVSVSPVAIPEPSAFLQTGIGAIGLAGVYSWWHRRRKQSQASIE